MIIVGLTGAIGAGKSTLSRAFRRQHVPVHSADEEIHNLIDSDKDVQEKIQKRWPAVQSHGRVDRVKLRNLALFEEGGLAHLESILYPKLLEKQKTFLKNAQKRGVDMVVMDVPLLFETGLDQYCHYVVVASSPKWKRKERVLRRKAMDDEQFQAFESHQMTDFDRKRKADFVVFCGTEKVHALKKTKEIKDNILKNPEKKWSGAWPTALKRINYGKRNRIRY